MRSPPPRAHVRGTGGVDNSLRDRLLERLLRDWAEDDGRSARHDHSRRHEWDCLLSSTSTSLAGAQERATQYPLVCHGIRKHLRRNTCHALALSMAAGHRARRVEVKGAASMRERERERERERLGVRNESSHRIPKSTSPLLCHQRAATSPPRRRPSAASSLSLPPPLHLLSNPLQRECEGSFFETEASLAEARKERIGRATCSDHAVRVLGRSLGRSAGHRMSPDSLRVKE